MHEWTLIHSFIREKFVDGTHSWTVLAGIAFPQKQVQ